ncbi:putative aldose 1-epimerase [Flavobacteriales bacterium ALC-1]|nr:putative aldose 1-epimerase [Flavobacteriales bacterium ALC-1]
MPILKNDLLKIDIKSTGAELCAINSVKNNTAFLWHADPNIWGGHAPNLFPVIGSMKNDSYIYDGKMYPMTKHGFVRNNDSFIIKDTSEAHISFLLSSNEELLKMYPFKFEFEISYALKENILNVDHTIKNMDTKTMYFSLGGHPAFNCPLNPNEKYTDYCLEFEKAENSESYLVNMTNGLIINKTKPAFNNPKTINLREDLFDEDALIFKDLKSKKVTLKHKNKGPVLSMRFDDFPYLGIWAKPNAPYVCIEPWIGIADSETANQRIEDKEGIIALNAGLIFNASYNIEIEKKHLV